MPEDTVLPQIPLNLLAEVTAHGVKLTQQVGGYTIISMFIPAEMWVELTKKLKEERQVVADVNNTIRRLH